MTNYVWRVKDKSGKSLVREVSANTIEESKAILVSEGSTELELFQDEVMAASISGMKERVTVMGEEIKVTAEQRLAEFNKPPMTFWKAIVQGAGQSKGLCLIALALCAFLIYRGQIMAAASAAVGLFAWLLFLVGISLPVVYYGRLHKAADWARWDEVLDLVGKLESNSRFNFIKVPAPELARYRATALAGMGRVEEAVAYYQRFENQPGCPDWLYQALLSGVYSTAQDYDKAIECSRKSIELKPTPTGYLDLANQLARHHGNALEAREAIVEAEKSTLTEIAKPFHHRCRGIIARLEGNYAEARQELELSIELMEKTRHLPGRDGNISVAKAYLCCVLAKLGDITSANTCLAEASDYLIATKEAKLLEECNQALQTA